MYNCHIKVAPIMSRQIFFALSALLFGLIVSGTQGILEPSRPKHDKIVVCYVAAWATYRPAKGQFRFEDLKPEHCTHLIYAFAGLNETTSRIKSLDPYLDLEEDYGKGTYKRMTGLRSQHPGLKVSLAIGGWNEGSANYSALAASPPRRKIFIDSVLVFMKDYGFDGLDLDWEFPAMRGGAPHDKENFSKLVKELSAAFKKRGLLLTAAISAAKKTIDAAYDIPEISKYLDFIHVMAYDYHGAWDKQVLPNAPLKCEDSLCVEESINHLLAHGAPSEKLVLGLPMYGRTFVLTTLLEKSVTPIGATALETGFMGNFTRENGFMGYNEICKELMDFPKNWRTDWYEDGNSAYAINEDRVVVFDNAKSLMNKAEYLTKMKLAGAMIWSIDTDDFNGACSKLHQEYLDPLTPSDYPLMRIINSALTKASSAMDDNKIDVDPSSAVTMKLSGLAILLACIVNV